MADVKETEEDSALTDCGKSEVINGHSTDAIKGKVTKHDKDLENGDEESTADKAHLQVNGEVTDKLKDNHTKIEESELKETTPVNSDNNGKIGDCDKNGSSDSSELEETKDKDSEKSVSETDSPKEATDKGEERNKDVKSDESKTDDKEENDDAKSDKGNQSDTKESDSEKDPKSDDEKESLKSKEDSLSDDDDVEILTKDPMESEKSSELPSSEPPPKVSSISQSVESDDESDIEMIEESDPLAISDADVEKAKEENKDKRESNIIVIDTDTLIKNQGKFPTTLSRTRSQTAKAVAGTTTASAVVTPSPAPAIVVTASTPATNITVTSTTIANTAATTSASNIQTAIQAIANNSTSSAIQGLQAAYLNVIQQALLAQNSGQHSNPHYMTQLQQYYNTLTSLQDDAYVIEAPSFIVPYVMEGKPEETIKDFLSKMNDEIEEHEKKLEEAKKKKKEEAKTEKEEAKTDKEEAKTEKDEAKTDKEEAKTEKDEAKTDKEEAKTDKEEATTDKEEAKTEKEEAKTDKDDTKEIEKKKDSDDETEKSDEANKKETEDGKKEEEGSDEDEKMETDDEEKSKKDTLEKDKKGTESNDEEVMEVDEENSEDEENEEEEKSKDKQTDADKSTKEDGSKEGDKENDDKDEITIEKEVPKPDFSHLGRWETYYNSALGKFFLELGLSHTQEFIQSDLLRMQKRRIEKLKSNPSRQDMVAVKTLEVQLNRTKNKNAHLRTQLRTCKFCSFKTESKLVMDRHLESPHMINYTYKCNFCEFETRGPQVILFHMEAEHNVRGRLERAPAFFQCPLCPYEDNNKSKMTRHSFSCTKKYRPEKNLDLPDWEPPAKIQKLHRGRPTPSHMKPLDQLSRMPNILPKGLGNISLNLQNAISSGLITSPLQNSSIANSLAARGRGRPVGSYKNVVPTITNRAATSSLLYPNRPTGSASFLHSIPGVSTAQQLSIANQMLQSVQNRSGTNKSPQQPSISITPLPRTVAPNTVSKTTISPANLRDGTGSKPPFVICEVCDGYIKDLEQLRNHMNLIHKVKIHPKMIYNRPPLNCQKCQQRFFTDQGLERHLLGTHGLVTSSMQEAANKGKDAGRCPICGKVFQWKLLNHVNRDHKMTLKPAHLSYKCTVCTATFNMYRLFENHVYSAHSVVKNKDGATQSNSSSASAASSNSNAAASAKKASSDAPLKINDEITIIPQPASKTVKNDSKATTNSTQKKSDGPSVSKEITITKVGSRSSRRSGSGGGGVEVISLDDSPSKRPAEDSPKKRGRETLTSKRARTSI